MKKILFLLCLIAVARSYGIEVHGTLLGDHVWSLEQSPIHVTNHVIIPAGSSLKIPPGVRVVFDDYFHLYVKGILEAVGEPEHLIVFTREQKAPRIALWKGLALYGEECRAVLSDCVVEYAFRNLCWKAKPIIRACTFRHNNYGLYCSNTKSATIMKNKFHRNIYGIYCDFSSPTIQGNTITKNEFGLYCIFSSTPLIGQNALAGNTTEDVFLDDSMGKNLITARNQHIWSLVWKLF